MRTPPEGFEDFASTPPLVDYLTRRQTVAGLGLVGEGTAVTGGFVYRGTAIPELYGMYVFGDYSIGSQAPANRPANQGRLFYLDPTNPLEIYEFQLAGDTSVMGQLLGFGDDDSGELYAFFDNGNLLRIIGLSLPNEDH